MVYRSLCPAVTKIYLKLKRFSDNSTSKDLSEELSVFCKFVRSTRLFILLVSNEKLLGTNNIIKELRCQKSHKIFNRQFYPFYQHI